MKRLVLVGGGNMGEALLGGMIRSKQWRPSQLTVTDVRPELLQRLRKKYGVNVSAENATVARSADIVLLAVKPQQITVVLGELGPVLARHQLLMSIAAGVTTSSIERYLMQRVPVIRVMPNTPALIGAGVSAMARGRWAKAPHEKMAQSILSTVGVVVSVAEPDMDAVTALSGSGPAYVFLLAEHLETAGLRLRLAPKVVDSLVRETLRGAGLLLAQSFEAPRTLRQRVTSPGGSTEAALKVLEGGNLGGLFTKALQKAAARSRELSRGDPHS